MFCECLWKTDMLHNIGVVFYIWQIEVELFLLSHWTHTSEEWLNRFEKKKKLTPQSFLSPELSSLHCTSIACFNYKHLNSKNRSFQIK